MLCLFNYNGCLCTLWSTASSAISHAFVYSPQLDSEFYRQKYFFFCSSQYRLVNSMSSRVSCSLCWCLSALSSKHTGYQHWSQVHPKWVLVACIEHRLEWFLLQLLCGLGLAAQGLQSEAGDSLVPIVNISRNTVNSRTVCAIQRPCLKTNK